MTLALANDAASDRARAAALAGGVLAAQVMHRRLRPKVNAFAYPVAYLCVPLSKLDGLARRWLRLDRAGLVAFHVRDHGPLDGSPLEPWARTMLAEFGLAEVCDGDIVLMAMPRLLGYVFNPVSFWFCRDRAGGLRAVLCEVHNTFGERHNYLVFHDDHRPIAPRDSLPGRKVFHVSPFLPVDGDYRFRFAFGESAVSVAIDYADREGLMLQTAVSGTREPLDDAAVRRRFLFNPFMTLGVVARIHWQALKLVWKRATFHSKPEPPAKQTTR
jgi:DUF1365 family protein